jgi:hypothetical protein
VRKIDLFSHVYIRETIKILDARDSSDGDREKTYRKNAEKLLKLEGASS